MSQFHGLETGTVVLKLKRSDLLAFDFTFTLGTASVAIAKAMTKIGMQNAPEGYVLPKVGVGNAVLPAEDPFAEDRSGRKNGGLMFAGPQGFEQLITQERVGLGMPGPHPTAADLFEGFCSWRNNLNAAGWTAVEAKGVSEVRGASKLIKSLDQKRLRRKLLTAWTVKTGRCLLSPIGIEFNAEDIFGAEHFPRNPADRLQILDKNTRQAFEAAEKHFGERPEVMADDNPGVLEAADEAGISKLLAVLNPNKKVEDYRVVAERRIASGKWFALVSDLSNVEVQLVD